MRNDARVPLELVTGPANSGKARTILDGVRGAVRDGREPLLVVPTAADAEHYRRELAAGGVVFGAQVERFDGLIRELGRRTGVAARPLSSLARERIAAAVSERATLRVLGGAAASAGFAGALTAFIAELESARVEPARLRVALRAWAGADRGRRAYGEEVATLYGGYRDALARLGRPDRELYAIQALDALRREPSLWGATPVFFYGFDDLTPLELDAVDVLARVAGAPVSLSLSYEPGRLAFSGRATTFAELLPISTAHRALEPRVEHYAPASRAALGHLERHLFEADAPTADPGEAIELLEGGGERAELELVGARIAELVGAGMEPGEIAVVLRSPDAHGPLLEQILRDLELPYTLARRVRFADTAAGGGLLALLRCALLGGSAEDLLRWLRTPGLLERPEFADRLEARMRAVGARSATQARAAWEREHWPLEAIDRLHQAHERGPGALLERVASELERLFAAPWRRQAPLLSGTERDEARALARARRSLEDLRELVAAAPELAPGPAELARALEELEVLAGEAPRPGAVIVADPLALRARRVRALFVCGLQEGSFPAPARPEPFLSDADRRELASASGLRLGGGQDTLGAERYLFYATLSRAEERLFVSWRTADDEGNPLSPSLFIDDVCDLFGLELRARRGRRELGAVDWPGQQPPGAGQARRGSALRAGNARPRPIAALEDAEVLAWLGARPVWSASALEAWAGCPVRWFVERLLSAEDLEPDPEPLVRGGLAHAVLETTLSRLAERTGSALLRPERLPLLRELLHEALGEQAAQRPISANPERRRAALRRLEADLERYLAHAASTHGDFVPTHFELEFGFEDSSYPPLELDDGAMPIRGRIDRVDVDVEHGHAIVYDYKGKQAPGAEYWATDRHFQVALYMRAVERLLGLRAVGGFYQPLGAVRQEPRGVLVDGVAAAAQPGDIKSADEAQALIDAAIAGAREALDQARAGSLEPRSPTCAFRGGCRYPAICRCES